MTNELNLHEETKCNCGECQHPELSESALIGLLATLKEEIESCFSDWDGDFSVELDPEDIDEIDDEVTCSVEVKHKHLDQKSYFCARIGTENKKCEMEIGEDCWCPVTMGNMFASMWFDLAFDSGR